MHQQYLEKALNLAKKRLGFCAPNPAVGCVIVKGQEMIGSGTHYQAGQPHAEQQALLLAGDSAEGADLYVTLEPCCHWGKTPPCTDAIIQAKIKRVFYSYVDPNPRVSGQGIQQLEASGIVCQHISLPSITEFYLAYTYWLANNKPWIVAKIALSLDGKIAAPDGSPVAITGDELATLTHQARYHSDALLTTAKTLIHDNPQFNARIHQDTVSKPLYILDRQCCLPDSLTIWQTAGPITIFYDQTIAAGQRLAVLEKLGARCVPIASDKALLNLRAIVGCIGSDGIHQLWVEAGGKLFHQLWQQRLLQQAWIYLAGKTLGSTAYSAFTEATNFVSAAKNTRWQPMGEDALLMLDL